DQDDLAGDRFFLGVDVLAGLLLLGGVAAQVAAGRAVQADADLAAEAAHGGAVGADAFGLLQVVGQLRVGPVSPLQALLGRPLDDPTADLVGQAVGDVGRSSLGLASAEAGKA